MLKNHLVCIYFVCHGDTTYVKFQNIEEGTRLWHLVLAWSDFSATPGVSLPIVLGFLCFFLLLKPECLCSTMLVYGEGIFEANEVQ